MRKIILLLTIALLSFQSNYAQKIKKLDSITFNQMEKLLNSKNYKNSVVINHYQTKLGDWLSVGDTLVIGKPSNQNNLETSNISGTRFSSNNHTHIFLGTMGAMMMGTAMFASDAMTGDKVFITKMGMGRISKKNPFEAGIEFNKVGGGRFLGTKKLARARAEVSLSSGEIINPKRGMTRKEAIAKLKETKELLDLGMASKEEFEALRKKLTPIIMNK